MMKTKVINNYLYEGLGFPIELETVEMRYVGEKWCPIINVKKVADEVIEQLAIQEARLTGNQVKFIRSYYSMSLREFGAKVAHESHMAVSQWEKREDLLTNMNANTEHELRLYIIENMHEMSNSSKSKFYDVYMATKRFFNGEQKKVSIVHANA